jgi:transmembrane sensor
MAVDRIETPALAEEAAHWLIELEESGSEVLRRFAAWLETSPRHVEEFLLAAAVWKEFDQFDVERRLDIQRLLDDARSNVRPLVPQGVAQRTVRAGRHRGRWIAVAGTAAAIVAAIAVWLLVGLSPETYATARGEQRALKLQDGSVVYLNTQSRVEVRYSKRARVIRLLEGEAMFNVEHDTTRPFRVMAGHTVIQAVGTRFNVYRSDTGATVSVVEGVVQISPDESTVTQPRVSAGEQARVSLQGEVTKRRVPDLAQLVAWRERRLVFRGNSLQEVATEFNRYNALQIHVEGAAVRGKQITGVFDADDPRSLIQFLERDAALSVVEDSQDVTIRAR